MTDFLDFLDDNLDGDSILPGNQTNGQTRQAKNVAITRSTQNGAYTWSCPSATEFDIVGYTLQRWIEQNADDSLILSERAWAEVNYSTDGNENYLKQGTMSFSYKGKLYGYIADWEKDSHRVFSETSESEAIEAMKHALRWKNPIRNKHLQIISGRRKSNIDIKIRNTPQIDFDAVVMDPQLRTELRDNTIYHLQNIQGDNGIILHGPPGTGKSLSCQAMIHETLDAGFSCCYIVGRIDFEALEGFVERYLSPCLIILEDIDTYAQNRRENPHSYFSDFLQFMSGLSDREEKIVVVATTNHIDFLDEAIARRPVRFNRRFLIGLPEEKQLTALLNHYFDECGELPDDAVSQCLNAGFTGSHIAEVRRTAEIRSQKANCTPSQCFQEAFETVARQFPRSQKENCGFIA